jgi:integrase
MPRQILPLTETAIKRCQPAPQPLKLADGSGLYLLVMPNGNRWWRLDFRFNGRRQTLSMGVYPGISLKQARERREQARKQIADGVNPAIVRKQAKRANAEANANSFEAIAREWFAKLSPNWVPGNAVAVQRRLERDLFPWIGDRPIGEIRAADLLSVLRRIESRGANETAHRARQYASQIFRYAVATGRAERDPSADLRGALAPVNVAHFPSITEPKAIGELIRAIQGYEGFFPTKCALRLAPLLFVRPGELRQAEWTEFDLDKAEWRIPASKMKARKPHIVPLSNQAIAILRELQPLTAEGKYLFPSVRTASRPMSNNTMNSALRRIGYTKDQMTPHGFRSMASTNLNEQGWNRDVIERQLAHGEQDGVRAAYNYAEHLPERRKMMQAWADCLDSLASTAPVIPLRRSG